MKLSRFHSMGDHYTSSSFGRDFMFRRLAVVNHAVCILTVVTCVMQSANAGPLVEAYQQFIESDRGLESHAYLVKAAEQDVVTEKRGYLPQLELEAKQLAVGQNIEQEGSGGVFEEGRASYGSTRVKLGLDQPLIDLTIKHKVDEAQAVWRYQQSVLRTKEEELTENFVDSFLEVVRLAQLEGSVERVIGRLESELKNVSLSLEEQLATIDEVGNIKSALLAMQQEKRLLQGQRRLLLTELGLEADVTSAFHDVSVSDLPVPSVGVVETDTPRSAALQAEVDAIDSKIAATSRKDAPRLSLYGLAHHDDAGGSEFGGERTLNGYEVGVMLKWNCFDRGINRSEVKKLTYLRRAKQAELAAFRARKEYTSRFAVESFTLDKNNLKNLDMLVDQQASMLEAIELSYRDGGDTEYIETINAVLVYEAQIRQRINGRIDYLSKHAEVSASQVGWNNTLIENLDSVIASDMK